ncbi:MAG: sigma-54 dependent transcriptional regulator, partial [Hymenobacteraceae bacterium]|nr:sigma-54 dependent transcriptional regulator [Hymenobacteraceae bacterium]MDX5483297.1 sigma-54 dependent transcriptional regulator [Hymenobacteraceae bacterium]
MSALPNKTRAKIFIMEDDLWYSQFLAYHLSLNPDHDVAVFNQVDDFLRHLHEAPDIVSLDYHLPGHQGEAVLKQVLEQCPGTHVLVVSGQEDISKAVQLMKQGAYDYIVKNDETKERLWSIVEKIKQHIALRKELEALRKEVGQRYRLGKELTGTSEPMRKVFSLVEKAASSNINVIITGETGTGKELVARAIHHHSQRAKKPFVALNVSAIPGELLESELFGHEKGAFTGAVTQRIGKFEEANGGTLFLDEIGDMHPQLQSKLLRVLQEREFARVGSNVMLGVDVRILSATNRNLLRQVRQGSFREDLYYRLLGVHVQLPPLRDRGQDLLLLAHKFLRSFCLQNGMEAKALSAGAQRKLLRHRFPGNVRELKAVVEFAAVLAEGNTVTAEDIQIQEVQEESAGEEKTLDEHIAETVQRYLDRYNYNVIR